MRSDEIRTCLRDLGRVEHPDLVEELVRDLDEFPAPEVVQEILVHVANAPEQVRDVHVEILGRLQSESGVSGKGLAVLREAAGAPQYRPTTRNAICSLLGCAAPHLTEWATDGLASPHRWVRLDSMEVLAPSVTHAERLWFLAEAEAASGKLLRSWRAALPRAAALRERLTEDRWQGRVWNVAEDAASGDAWAARYLLVDLLHRGPAANRLLRLIVDRLASNDPEPELALDAIRSWQFKALYSARVRPYLRRFSLTGKPRGPAGLLGDVRGYLLAQVGPQRHRARAFHMAREMEPLSFSRS